MTYSRVSCAECGTRLGGRTQDTFPCPSCGSRSRRVEVTGRAFLGVTAILNATTPMPTGALHGTVHDSGVIAESAPATVVGQPVAHTVTVVFSEPSKEGVFFAQVQDKGKKVLACGYGDNHVDALLDLIPALLPPDHPEHETLAEQPDDLI